jgi:putative ABC transport system permease protein
MSQASLAERESSAGAPKKQVNLPWPKAFRIAMNSLKIRFWRSMVTGSGILLGIAFLCFSWANLMLELPPPHAIPGSQEMDEFMQSHNRQIWLVTMALLVCLVGIMNSMLMSVAERFREIGTMKCLGALNSLIVRLFVIESLFMGIISSMGGWLIGFIGVLLVHAFSKGEAPITPAIVFNLFAGCVSVGATLTLVAALLPAVRAAQMPPAAALRTEV